MVIGIAIGRKSERRARFSFVWIQTGFLKDQENPKYFWIVLGAHTQSSFIIMSNKGRLPA